MDPVPVHLLLDQTALEPGTEQALLRVHLFLSLFVDTHNFWDPDQGNENIRICGYGYFLGSGSREQKYPYLWIRIFSRIRIQGTKMSSDPSLQNYESVVNATCSILPGGGGQV